MRTMQGCSLYVQRLYANARNFNPACGCDSAVRRWSCCVATELLSEPQSVQVRHLLFNIIAHGCAIRPQTSAVLNRREGRMRTEETCRPHPATINCLDLQALLSHAGRVVSNASCRHVADKVCMLCALDRPAPQTHATGSCNYACHMYQTNRTADSTDRQPQTRLPSIADSKPACAMDSTLPGLAARYSTGFILGNSRRTWHTPELSQGKSRHAIERIDSGFRHPQQRTWATRTSLRSAPTSAPSSAGSRATRASACALSPRAALRKSETIFTMP